MKNLKFPITFQFKISTFANDFVAKDAYGDTVAYVRQKMFKFKESIDIYSDEAKSRVDYQIKADRWLDFSAAYALYDANGNNLGKVVRKGWRSIWKAHYQIIDDQDQLQYTISEGNAWIKVFDSLIGEVPVLGMFTGYLLNPSYVVADLDNNPIVVLKKQPSFFGRKFELNQVGSLETDEDDERIMLSLMMMILLERRRG